MNKTTKLLENLLIATITTIYGVGGKNHSTQTNDLLRLPN